MSMSKRSFVLLSALPVALLIASCNVIIDADPMSCSTDADCVNFQNFICNAEEGLCVTQDLCTSNDACAADEICRPVTPRRCEKIRQGNCLEIYPDDDTFRDDRAMLVGVSAPLTESDIGTGVSIVNGAKLGAEQFNKDGGVEGVRPIVLVICDDRAEEPDAFDNGQTLAKLGVQSMIGPAFSGQAILTAGSVEKEGTVQSNVLMISSSATSNNITGIEDKSPRCVDECNGAASCVAACPGLVWRTAPTDTFQGAALSKYFTEELEDVVAARGEVDPPRATLKVWVLYKPDSYGDVLSEEIRTRLTFNGMPATTQQGESFFRTEYADLDPKTPGIQPDPTDVDEALSEAPDAVFIIGTSEVAEIISDFEAGWTAKGFPEADRPYYILGDGGLGEEVASLARSIAAAPAPARPLIERIRGSVPGPAQSAIFDAFSGDYGSKFTPDPEIGHGPNVFGASGAFDAVFMLAYASIAARGAPLTAEQLATGLASLVDTGATVIEAGSAKIGQAASELGDGRAINFEGASGQLDLNIDTGEGPSPIQIWCVPPTGDSGINTGAYFDVDEVLGPPEPLPAEYACPFPQ